MKDKIKALSKSLKEVLEVAIIAAVIVLPIRMFIFQPFIVSGASMQPTFHTGDYLIIDEISYRFNEPQRGDVVVFEYPNDPAQKFIKRVIGLPGETIEVSEGKVYLIQDDQRIQIQEDTYLPKGTPTPYDKKMTLNSTQYFVMGDNRAASYDSRRWGALPKDLIIGKSILKVFSLPKALTPTVNILSK